MVHRVSVAGVQNPEDWVPSAVRHPVLSQAVVDDLVDRALAMRAAEACLGAVDPSRVCAPPAPL